jgi:predicted enzyme related to lactoylglutathione lyase
MANNVDGQFVWYEHITKDAKAAIAFYSEVVGWKTEPFAESKGEYTMWVGPQGALGGVMKITDEMAKMGVPPHWMAHVQVADVDKTAALAKKLGGKVLKEPTDIATVGRFAVIGDPQGASISVFKPSKPMTAHDKTKEGEFCWNELLTSDLEGAFKFYSELFGWKKEKDMDMGPMGTYRLYGDGTNQYGGMMTIPKGNPAPPMWMYYVETNDLDAALGRAESKGAKLMNGPTDVPGGRIVQLMDPQGAPFALHQLVKK